VGCVAVTGSASGIGAAVRARLERAGARVLGVDLRDAEVIADLGTSEGRTAATAGVLAAADGRLDGLVACAGLGPHVELWSTIVSVNYFGAQALCDGLRPALAAAKPAAAVIVSSNSSTVPGSEGPVVDACLAGDEAEARRIALEQSGHQAYAGSKLALTRWMRRNATSAEWAGAGIRLNAVAPGPVTTPLLQAGLDHPIYGPAIRGFPVPLGGFGTTEQIAAAVAFLLDPEAAFCCGSVLFVDGGTDALLRPDQY
jgi:NAD(P)-dependent dehydrogenase (short-subunit alcohol dehydrogenase family)